MSETININVDGINAERVQSFLLDQIGNKIARAFEAKVDEAIDRLVAEHLEALVKSEIKARITAETEAFLSEGWPRTNEYGEPTGAVVSLRDRVRGSLDKKDSYDRTSFLEKSVNEATRFGLEKVMKEEIEVARVKFRAAFDEVLQAKFTESIRKALGMGVSP